MFKSNFRYILVLLFLFIGQLALQAQPTWTLNPFGKEDKPKEYEEKLLPSEKTGNKKFTRFRRFIQNNTTRFNYYFNANEKLNAVIDRAKSAQQDDYLSLLSFYPYSLDNTKTQQSELDSVIYKATAGILLHDLRTDWVDNMYLLIGKSYYLRQEFDSAALTFQFINYNLFPRKKNEEYNRVVGTNNAAGKGISIADAEKRNIIQKTFTLAPSRNEALIWLIRTNTDQEAYGDAAGMINILQNDRNLPKRLQNDLEEVVAYWFYKQHQYDSAAVHLENALSTADNKQDQSRWEYLLAQLNEMNGNYDKASSFYNLASRHTSNPVMDIYARLSDAKMLRKNGDEKELQNSINELLRMARKDKYDIYRDIIYYSAAELSLQVPDTLNSTDMYGRSIKYNTSNPGYRNKSFLQLGEIAFAQKNYKLAHSFYDSLNIGEIKFSQENLEKEMAALQKRKSILAMLANYSSAIERQDSLQTIAAMGTTERDDYLKKLLRKLRKDRGLKEEDLNTGTLITPFGKDANAPTDLFAGNEKGDWYFYNSNAKSKGFSEFRSRWGKREDKDNWRRKAASGAANTPPSKDGDPGNPMIATNPDLSEDNGMKPFVEADPNAPITMDMLMADLPLTSAQMDSSNKTIARSLLSLALIFQNELEDYPEAINTYLAYLERFDAEDKAAAYFGLYFCYFKLNNTAKANYYKNLMATQYAGSDYYKRITYPASLEPNKPNPVVTKRYEDIYDLYLAGKFTEAAAAKAQADSVYGKNYWSPQLLYIEAVQLIKDRKDSNAMLVLTDLQTLYPTSPLKYKASTLAEVLSRREAIESYLTNLEVTRAEEDIVIVADVPAKVEPQKPVVAVVPKVTVTAPVKPNIITEPIKTPEVYKSEAFVLQPNAAHYVVMLLDKVDGVYVNEAKNAFTRFNKSSMQTQNVQIGRDNLEADKVMLLFSPFEDATTALAYFERVKKAAAVEVSWLQANKYSFFIITEDNLQLLKQNKKIAEYKTLLNNNYGNKF